MQSKQHRNRHLQCTALEEGHWERQLYVDVADLLLAETRQWMLDMQAAVEDGDMEQLRILLEAVTGSMSIFGVESVCRAGSALEKHLEELTLEELKSEIAGLKVQCRRAFSEIRQAQVDESDLCETDVPALHF